MKVSEAMTREVEIIDPNAAVGEAARRIATTMLAPFRWERMIA